MSVWGLACAAEFGTEVSDSCIGLAHGGHGETEFRGGHFVGASAVAPLFQLRVPWLNVSSVGRFRNSITYRCCSPTSPAHPIAPVAMFLTVSVFPVIVACPPRGPHLVVTVTEALRLRRSTMP